MLRGEEWRNIKGLEKNLGFDSGIDEANREIEVAIL